LNLRGNINIGTMFLSDALKINTTLTTLDLGSSCIGDVDAEFLSSALNTNTTLTSLDLGGNHIGDKLKDVISLQLKKNKNIAAKKAGTEKVIEKVSMEMTAKKKVTESTVTEDQYFSKRAVAHIKQHLEEILQMKNSKIRGASLVYLEEKLEEEKDVTLFKKLEPILICQINDPFDFVTYSSTWQKYFRKLFSVKASSIIENHLKLIATRKTEKTRYALFALLEEHFENLEDDLNLLLYIEPNLNFKEFNIDTYSAIFHDYCKQSLQVEDVVIPLRSANRFGDGLQNIVAQKVEFYSLDYLPTKSALQVLLQHAGDILGNQALLHENQVVESTLSKDHIAIIYLYTVESPFYSVLNKTMRSGTTEERQIFQDYIYYLTQILSLLEPFQGSVYRAIDFQIPDYSVGKK